MAVGDDGRRPRKPVAVRLNRRPAEAILPYELRSAPDKVLDEVNHVRGGRAPTKLTTEDWRRAAVRVLARSAVDSRPDFNQLPASVLELIESVAIEESGRAVTELVESRLITPTKRGFFAFAVAIAGGSPQQAPRKRGRPSILGTMPEVIEKFRSDAYGDRRSTEDTMVAYLVDLARSLGKPEPVARKRAQRLSKGRRSLYQRALEESRRSARRKIANK